MHGSTNKLLFFLLALTLLFSPLQGAFAGLGFHVNQSSQHEMLHVGESMDQMDANQMTSGDCQHCFGQKGCSQHNCSYSHCTTCIPGLIGYFQSGLTIRSNDFYERVNQTLFTSFISHLYRPPKA